MVTLDDWITTPRLQHLAKKIFKYLDPKSVGKCREVSRKWKSCGFLLNLHLKQSIINIDSQMGKKVPYYWSEWKKPMSLLLELIETDNIEDLRIVMNFLNEFPRETHFGTPKSILHLACKFDHYKLVKLLIQKDPQINIGKPLVLNKEEMSPFHYACQEGHVETVKTFVLYGNVSIIDFDARDKLSQTAFHLACKKGHSDIVEFLIGNSNNLNINILSKDESDESTLHSLAQIGNHEIVKLLVNTLLHSQININILDDFDQTPLHYACRYERTEVVRVLLESNMDITVKDKEGNTALHYACFSQSFEIVELMLMHAKQKNFDFAMKNENSQQFLHCAIKSRNPENLKLILKHFPEHCLDLNAPDYNGQTPIHYAFRYGNHTMMDGLLQTNLEIDFSSQDIDGNTPIHYAPSNPDFPLIVKLLSEHLQFFNFNTRNKKEKTVLHYTCQTGNSGIVHSLAQLSNSTIDFNAQDYLERSPLIIACGNSKSQLAQYLIDNIASYKIDVYASDKEGRNALHYACQNGHYDTVETLLEYFNYEVYDNDQLTPLHHACRSNTTENARVVKLLLDWVSKHKLYLNKSHQNPLHIACTLGNDLITDMFFATENSFIIDINVQDIHGQTLLHKICDSTSMDTTSLGLFIERSKDYNIDFNIRDAQGRTPLHLACQIGNFKVINTLLKNVGRIEINANLQDKMGKTPLHYIFAKPMLGMETDNKRVLTKLLPNYSIIDFNVKDKDGNTPLHCACLKSPTDSSVSTILYHPVSTHINVNLANNNGETPIAILCCKISTGLPNPPNPKGQNVAKDLVNIKALLKYATSNNIPLSFYGNENVPLNYAYCQKVEQPNVQLLKLLFEFDQKQGAAALIQKVDQENDVGELWDALMLDEDEPILEDNESDDD